MFTNTTRAAWSLAIAAIVAAGASAQTVSGLRDSRSSPTARAASRPAKRTSMRSMIEGVDLQDMPARDALEWWSSRTDISVVVNWRGLQDVGVDPDAPVNLRLIRAPANKVLDMVLKQMGGYEPLMYEINAGYIEVLTRAQLNRRTEVRLYDVGDLLIAIPRFDQAPKLDLEAALEGNNSGGSGSGGRGGGGSGRSGGSGGGGGGIFVTNDEDDEEEETRADRADGLAQLIRDSIEPEIWFANGGEFASIRYFNNYLVVNAPRYVHEQIGVPSVTTRRTSSRSSAARSTSYRARSYVPSRSRPQITRPYSRSYLRPRSSVSGIQRTRSSRVSGISY